MIPPYFPGTIEESHQLLEAIRHVQSLVTSSRDPQFVLDETLSALLAVTGSEHGFLGEVRTGDRGQRYIGVCSVQTRSSDPRVLNFFQQYSKQQVEFRKSDSLIGHVLYSEDTLVTNTPSSDLRGGGLPEGHPPLASFAGLPLRTKNGMVGMLGLANRPGGYEEAQLSYLQPLVDCCSNFIDLHHAQEQVRSRAEVFQRSFQNTHEALAITGAEGKIIDWNPQAAKLTGYIKDEVVGSFLPELDLKWDAAAVAGMLSAARQQGYGEADLAFYNRTGHEVFTKTNVFPVTGVAAQEAYMWVIRDLTWRKNAERELQEANDRFEIFAQNSRSAFWITSLDGGTTLYMSPAIEAIIGRRIDRFPINTEYWIEMIHPDDRERVLANRRTYAAGVPVLQKYRIILPGGRIRWIQSHAFPVKNSRGEVYRLAGLLEDITEHEETVAKMHAAVADREVLLKEMYHRVKNNLQIISSLMRLQEKAANGADASTILQESRHRVETIALLHDLLSQSENFSHIPFQFYAKRLIANLIGTRPNIQFTVDVEPLSLDFQTAVLCGLILNELLTNSLKHAFPNSEKGEITVRSQTRNKRLSMIVSDNGTGMPPEFDLEKTTTLGLTLVRRLTRQLKGTISVSSQSGANVRIEFPSEMVK
ncbi:MAG TPA: PAS domain S-box protein [Bryobacteraceae bacterium]|nr:PAS domain S-box protein [Bryobacteraceae bacterium]